LATFCNSFLGDAISAVVVRKASDRRREQVIDDGEDGEQDQADAEAAR
jgi:hypothetical protein